MSDGIAARDFIAHTPRYTASADELATLAARAREDALGGTSEQGARLSLHFEVTDPSLTDEQLNEVAERIVAQADLLNPCLAFDSVGITRA